jgi:hypothetical protein
MVTASPRLLEEVFLRVGIFAGANVDDLFLAMAFCGLTA